MSPVFTHLVLGGGGLLGLTYAGVLRMLEQEGLANRITHVSGSSIGALFGLCFVLGHSAETLEGILKDIFADTAITTISLSAGLKTIFKQPFHMDDGATRFKRIFDKIMGANDDPTFMELAKRTGKHFVVCATCLETNTPKYFSVDTDPHVRVREAIRASMSIPLIWEPVNIGEYHYVDGCAKDPLPYTPFGTKEREGMLCIRLGAKSKKPPYPCGNLLEYCGVIFGLLVTPLEKTIPFLHLDECPTQFLPLVWTSTTAVITISTADIDAAIAYGYTSMYDYVQTITNAS